MNKNFNSCNDPALWGGIECTINRVRDDYKDQLQLTGHYDRPDDILHFSRLGIAKMRYPILWERHAPVKNQRIDWNFTSGNLEKLLDLKIEPIAGLLHHGSGPVYTNLLDPDFASQLADYAFAVASRFPFLKDFTPVNEPLTTARFSGLYGLWYPHHSDDLSFARMLLNQLKGIVLSMQAIRAVNPDARLIQTEDLGKTHSTPGLAYQADFENHRRWLTYDILCGRLKPGHPLWSWFTECLNCSEADLRFFWDNPCAPDVLGLNYYVTSERWLDERLEDYPSQTHGKNQFQRYADTEVVRSRPDLRLGLGRLGTELWNRYRITLAVTEVHLHCTREEQVRWFSEVWNESCALTRKGIPVEGVTLWSLIGAFDWDSLLTQSAQHYEPGAFITQGQSLRPTALAVTAQIFGSGYEPPHPLLKGKGWWHGPQPLHGSPDDPALLILGEDEKLLTIIQSICRLRGIPTATGTDFPEPGHNTKFVPQKPPFWNFLRCRQDSTIHFHARNMECVAKRGSPLHPIVHQVLDLLIDAVDGTWQLDGIGMPVLQSCAEVEELRILS